MKKIFTILKFTLSSLILIFLIIFCSNKRFLVAPEFTNVEKITKLKVGMTIEEVNSTLGISPYDAYNFDLNNLIIS